MQLFDSMVMLCFAQIYLGPRKIFFWHASNITIDEILVPEVKFVSIIVLSSVFFSTLKLFQQHENTIVFSRCCFCLVFIMIFLDAIIGMIIAQ